MQYVTAIADFYFKPKRFTVIGARASQKMRDTFATADFFRLKSNPLTAIEKPAIQKAANFFLAVAYFLLKNEDLHCGLEFR